MAAAAAASAAPAAALEAVAPPDNLGGLVQDFVLGQQDGAAELVAAGTDDGAAWPRALGLRAKSGTGRREAGVGVSAACMRVRRREGRRVARPASSCGRSSSFGGLCLSGTSARAPAPAHRSARPRDGTCTRVLQRRAGLLSLRSSARLPEAFGPRHWG